MFQSSITIPTATLIPLYMHDFIRSAMAVRFDVIVPRISHYLPVKVHFPAFPIVDLPDRHVRISPSKEPKSQWRTMAGKRTQSWETNLHDFRQLELRPRLRWHKGYLTRKP